MKYNSIQIFPTLWNVYISSSQIPHRYYWNTIVLIYISYSFTVFNTFIFNEYFTVISKFSIHSLPDVTQTIISRTI